MEFVVLRVCKHTCADIPQRLGTAHPITSSRFVKRMAISKLQLCQVGAELLTRE